MPSACDAVTGHGARAAGHYEASPERPDAGLLPPAAAPGCRGHEGLLGQRRHSGTSHATEGLCHGLVAVCDACSRGQGASGSV